MMTEGDFPGLSLLSLPSREPLASVSRTIVCLGNFDGVHLGHLALLREAERLREEVFPGAALGVFCFSEPPSSFFPGGAVPRLNTLDEKLSLFGQSGIGFAALGDFPSLRDLTPSEFTREICEKRLCAQALVCGFNFRFGKMGAGTPDDLKAIFPGLVSVVPPVCLDDLPVSSTRIRESIQSGRVDDAARLLSRPFSLTSPVLHGKALGRKLGFPTVNQVFDPRSVLPRLGVYVTRCEIDGKTYKGITNVGNRPTVDQSDAPVNCETYLIGFSGDLYGRELRVEFLRFLRPEIRFSDTEALAGQIALDLAEAQK